MAKVKPEMPHSGYQEEYVLCSGVRSGLKREFAFALKAQTDILISSVGRTRSGKAQNSAAPSLRETRSKRRKKLYGGISASARIRVLRESDEEKSLETLMPEEYAVSVGVDTDGKVVAASNADSLVVPTQFVRETGDNVTSISVGEISENEANQTNQFEEDSMPEKAASNPESPESNRAVGENTSEKLSANQVLSRPIQNLAQCDPVKEGPSRGTVPPIRVYSRSATKMAKRNRLADGPSLNMVPHIVVYDRSITKMLRKRRLMGQVNEDCLLENSEKNGFREGVSFRSSIRVESCQALDISQEKSCLMGEASSVKLSSNHVENDNPELFLSSIQADESCLLNVCGQGQSDEGVDTESTNRVESHPVLSVPQANYFHDEPSVENKTPINYIVAKAIAEDVLSIQAGDTLPTEYSQTNHANQEPATKTMTEEMVQKERNLSDQISEDRVANDSPMSHVDEGASMEDFSSVQIDVIPLKNCSDEMIPIDVVPVSEDSMENYSSVQEAEVCVPEIMDSINVEKRIYLESTSAVEARASHVERRGVHQRSKKKFKAEIHVRRFTRSLLKDEQEEHSGSPSLHEDETPMEKSFHSNNIEGGDSLEVTPSVVVSASNAEMIPAMDWDEELVKTVVGKGLRQKRRKKATIEQPIRRFTRSLLKVEEMEVPGTLSLQEELVSVGPVENTSLVKAYGSHEAIIEHNVQIENGSCQNTEQNVLAGEPLRRFTWSLLKVDEIEQSIPVVEEESVEVTTEVSSAVSSTSNVCEEMKGLADTVNVSEEPLRVTPKRKMELKMSKKIALSKLPSNVRELFATGLLEGLPVKYRSQSYKKQGGFHGVIRGGGILCFCDSCKGLNVVSAYNFELHAGSRKKHPSDFICLENGNTLHDVLRLCSSAPLDMLESTIQSAICSEGGKIFKAEKFRDSCTKSLSRSSESPRSPNPSQEAASTSRPSRFTFSMKSYERMQKFPSSQKGSRGRMTTKDLRLHKLVFMDDILPEGTEVAYYSRGQRLLDGYIQNSGIFCHCCNTVISPSLFEAHAGCSSRRKPYLNIYTSNGVSLHELSVSLSKGKKFSSSESDDLCRICGDGGDLLLCDICPRAYHKECIGMTDVPTGDWYCPCCQNMQLKDKSGQNSENAIAAGRVAGVDPIEEIFKRCIRIAKSPEANVGGCVLCRLHDFSRSEFGPRTVLLCDQCEREFHVGCLKEHNLADLTELPEGKWFCSPDCDRIHDTLEKLLASGEEKMPLCAIDVIKKKRDDQPSGEDDNLDIRWRIFSGKSASPETRTFLSKALSIFYESFDPIVDFATKKDLIPAMVYGWDLMDQDFGGMFCAVLTVNSTVVSAAILRVLGREVAELPLVATSREYQGKGYFQSLFLSIEAFLDSLKVKHLVLPAAEEAEAIWTNKFGFSKISFDQLNEYLKGIRMMIFQGTSLLHKEVSGPPKPEESAGK